MNTSTCGRDQPASARSKRGPYQGLIPYDEEDADYFFGRDSARDIVLDNLLAYRMSILYGPSGVGKSSLLRAGVVRHVRDEGRRRIQNGEAAEHVAIAFSSWTEDPVVGLKEAICGTLEQHLSRPLKSDMLGASLADVVSDAAQRLDGVLFIILDQFEEYFLYHAPDGPFVDQLTRAIARRDVPASVLISIREDALATLDALAGLMPSVLDNLVRIDHLDPGAAREAIEKPLALWNREEAQDGEQVRIEPALVEAVLDGVQSGGLHPGEFDGVGGEGDRASAGSIQTPYLQLVLTRLWEEEQRVGSRVLRLSTMDRLQGAARIVTTHVDTAIATLSPAEQTVAARVLRQLVTPSGTKIALRTADLAEYAELEEPAVAAVLERLTREARILQAIGQSRYEIYHDALARPILDWRRRWQADQDRSRERRRSRVIASIAVGLLLTVIVVAALAVLAVNGRRDARRQAADASSVALASAARDELNSQPDVSLLLALAALGQKERAESRHAMVAAREASGPATIGIMRGHANAVNGVAFVQRGRAIVSAGRDGRVLLWDAATHRRLGRFASAATAFSTLTVSRDGRTLAVGAEDGRIWLWDVASRSALGILSGGHRGVFSVAFSADGRTLASAGDEHRIRLWDVTRLKPLARSLKVPDRRTYRVVFSPDGRTLASTGSLDKVRLWSVRTGRQRGRPFDRANRVTSVAFAHDGRTLGIGGDGIWLWDLRSGRKRRVSVGVEDQVNDIAFSPDGRRLASAGEQGKIRLWDVASERPLGPPLTGPTAFVNRIAFSPDGTKLASAGDDKKVWLFDVALPRVLERARHAVNDVAFDRTGRTLATAGYDRKIWLWDVRARRALGPPLVGAQAFNSVAFAPDGRMLASGSDDAQVLLWNMKSRRVAGPPLVGHAEGVNSVAFSPDGHLLASGSQDGTVLLWDVKSHRAIGDPLRGHRSVNAVAFSPDGGTLASAGSDMQVRLWDIKAKRPRGRTLRRQSDMVNDVAFSPDGRTLASAGSDGKIWLWDVKTRRARAQLTSGDFAILSIAFSPDGRTLVAGDVAGRIQLWDTSDRRRVGRNLAGHTMAVNAVAVSADARTFASGSSDFTAKLWSRIIWSDEQTLRTEICELVGSGLSRAEWTQYAAGVDYRSICDR